MSDVTPAESSTEQTNEPTREELIKQISDLRREIGRLKDEIRQLRHARHEVPPHYL
jgi:hypothetical protein